MDRAALKELMMGGLSEIAKNRKYYYHSSVGAEYSHFTDEGKEAISEFLNVMVFKLRQAEEKELNQRAKDLVIKGLKGEQL